MQDIIKNSTPWKLIEKTKNKEQIRQNETLFTLSNGHIGTRGSLEEVSRTPLYSYSNGTYMNAFYDTDPIIYGEWAYGYAEKNQTIIPLPDGKNLEFSLDGEVFDMDTGDLLNHERILDLKKGLLTRRFTWENSHGTKIKVKIERLVSYDYPEIIGQRIEFTPYKDESELIIKTGLDELNNIKRISSEESKDPRKREQLKRRFNVKKHDVPGKNILSIKTHNSGLNTTVGSITAINDSKNEYVTDDLNEKWIIKTKSKYPIILERFIGYGDIFTDDTDIEENVEQLKDTLSLVNQQGFDNLKQQHIETMKKFWRKSDLKIEGDKELQIGLRFNIFHLNQAAGRDGKTNIGAKGLTGEGYEGHYFWDTEMYMLPFFIYNQPEVARKLLEYRYNILPQARKRAREMSIDNGALYAWRTINGEEASAYYPAGTAQIHINADIAHGVYTYIKASNDLEFASTMGLEILIETARFWAEYGYFDNRRNNAFVINGVTGPDEYTAIVDNNFYTNLMAKNNLKYAVELTEEALKNNKSEDVFENIKFDISEIERWKKAYKAMYLPYDDEKKLTMQDDSFFNLKVWDLEATPEDKFPLLLHYHPLTIYRHQVNKQADTVLAQLLFSWKFDLKQKIRDFEYYEGISTHDSSLSRSIYGMMASEIGDLDKAYNYFMDVALMDLIDMQENTKDGVHTANMGGTWMSLVYGFAGMRVYNGSLHFSPKIPRNWNSLQFSIQYHNRMIEVMINTDQANYRLISGEPIDIYSNNEKISLN